MKSIGIIVALAVAGTSRLWVCAGPITALKYSPDGAALISAADGGIVIRSPDDAAVRRRVTCGMRKTCALAFHPAGRRLAVTGGVPGASGSVVLMDWPDGREIHRFEIFTDESTCVAFSRDGAFLAAGSADHSVRIWRLADPGADPVSVASLQGHAGAVQSVVFAGGGTNLISASADRSIKVWSVPDGRLLRSLAYHTEAVQALAIGAFPAVGGVAEREVCASAGLDQTVRIWQPGIGRMVRIIRHHGGALLALAYLPDGSALFSAGAEGVIRRIDAESDAILDQWTAHSDWIYSLAMSPDGRRLASGDWTGEVRVWETRKEVRPAKEVGP